MLKSINDLGRGTSALRPQLDAAVARVLSSGWFILGPEVRAFEQAFAMYCGAQHAVGVANGTDAITLGLRALDLGAGSVVATVANAGMYSSVAIRTAQASPFYVDIDPRTMLMDLDLLQDALVRTRIDAVVATHLFGQMVDMPRLQRMAAQHGFKIVEDCAQAHGAEMEGRRAGSFGDVGCFSFYPTKNLGALGDGGAVLTSDDHTLERLRSLRQYGWKRKYECDLPNGTNSRLDEMQAAILSVMLPHLDGWNARRRDIAQAYVRAIKHPDVELIPLSAAASPSYVGHLFVLRSTRREALRSHLAAAGIPTDVHYPVPDHLQATASTPFLGTPLPHTEAAAAAVLTLPCFPAMSDDEVSTIAACIRNW